MHLFLIRHGETEHNIAGLLAGATDSRLTNHGVLQAQRLGRYLASTRNLRLTHLFASDLQRAWMTAVEIRKGQEAYFKEPATLPEIVKLELLREQDFGSLELTPWTSKRDFDTVDLRTDPSFRHKESFESMKSRADQFLDNFVGPLWAVSDDPQSQCVAVVSHGLFLASLWKALLLRFEAPNIHLGPEIGPISADRPLEYISGWSNTGYLELEVIPVPVAPSSETIPAEDSSINTGAGLPPLLALSLRVHMINGSDHLYNLKRTRGGLGSAVHDTKQKQIDGFFKPSGKDDDATMT